MKQDQHTRHAADPGGAPCDEPAEGAALKSAAAQMAAADAEIDRILSGNSEDFLKASRQHGGQ